MPPTKSWTLKQHPTCLSDSQKFASQIADLTARLEKLEKVRDKAAADAVMEGMAIWDGVTKRFVEAAGKCLECGQPLESCTCPPGV